VSRSPVPAARKSLGQHFLHDQQVLDAIAEAVAALDGELVVEVGPGTGQLTAALLERYRPILALEVDQRMVEHVRRRFRGNEGFSVVQADARDADIANLVAGHPGYVVVGNLPYFAASPIIRRFLEQPPQPRDMVVMVQREVAEEIAAEPGDFSLLSIGVQVYATAEILFTVPPEAFDPPPKVVSAVVRITPRPEPLVTPDREADFFQLVTRTFKHRRKQVHNALERSMLIADEEARHVLERAGIDPSLRPERLTIADWVRLLEEIDRGNA
jgi:16S rRNA (adenine1518-N6/adenine1519-N6)-dimethyltransferase